MPTTKREAKRRYKLLRGIHVGEGPKGCTCSRCEFDRKLVHKEGSPVAVGKKGHIYHRGDIIETSSDLTGLNSANDKDEIRYQRVDHDGQMVRSDTGTRGQDQSITFNDELETLGLDELRKIAEEEEIDTSNLKTKQSLVKAIRSIGVIA